MANIFRHLYLYELEHFRPFEGNAKADYLFDIKEYVKIFSEIQGSTYYAQVKILNFFFSWNTDNF